MNRQIDKAFTRIEALAVIGAVTAIGLATFPSFGGLGESADRSACANNLRLLGRAIQDWAGDFGGRVPWRTTISQGGTMPEAGNVPGAAWIEYYFLSNHIGTPRVLACPSDETVEVVETFGHLAFSGPRNRALSYPVSLDVVAEDGNSWLSSDRNLRSEGFFTGCSSRKSGPDAITDQGAWWTNAVHGERGHLLLNDGRVNFTTSEELRSHLLKLAPAERGHFLRVGQ